MIKHPSVKGELSKEHNITNDQVSKSLSAIVNSQSFKCAEGEFPAIKRMNFLLGKNALAFILCIEQNVGVIKDYSWFAEVQEISCIDCKWPGCHLISYVLVRLL